LEDVEREREGREWRKGKVVALSAWKDNGRDDRA
jgi:hypothetical protein